MLGWQWINVVNIWCTSIKGIDVYAWAFGMGANVDLCIYPSNLILQRKNDLNLIVDLGTYDIMSI